MALCKRHSQLALLMGSSANGDRHSDLSDCKHAAITIVAFVSVDLETTSLIRLVIRWRMVGSTATAPRKRKNTF